SKLVVAGPDKLSDAEMVRIKISVLGQAIMFKNGAASDIRPETFRELVKRELAASPDMFIEPESTGQHALREPAPYEALLRLTGSPPELDRLTDADIRWFLTTTDGRAFRDMSGAPEDPSPDEFRAFVKKELGG
ncbi:MAG: hypothetical protein ACRDQF_08135, partial [Thermocrispum sp.]